MNAQSPSTDPSLLEMLALPDSEAAWRTFVTLYGPVIDRYARQARLSPDDAEEVRARVLAALTTALPRLRYDPARRFRGYLRTTVDNAARRLGREAARRPGDRASGRDADRDLLARVEAPDPFAGLGDEIEADLHARLRLAERALERVRGQVAAETWAAYWQTAVERRPAAEVAAALGKSVGAVYMAKNRVKTMLLAEGQRVLAEPLTDREPHDPDSVSGA